MASDFIVIVSCLRLQKLCREVNRGVRREGSASFRLRRLAERGEECVKFKEGKEKSIKKSL